MSWRVVVVSSNAKVDFKMDYLSIRTLEFTKKVHLSEVAVLILESTAISITAYALCELTKRKIKVIFCDHHRNPSAELIPLIGSHDSSAKIRQQINWSSNLKETIWTEIVRAKISKQRDVLLAHKRPQAELLTEYLSELQFNDSTNREGHAAKVYFNALFGMEFTRSTDCLTNAALNYGYTILLSAVNREISTAGYLTQLGIFHDNTYNPFNLGSDLMEPIRPLVDNTVINMVLEQFESEEKLELINVLNSEVIVKGKTYHLTNALQIYCGSVFKALQSGDISELELIEYEL